MSRLLLLPLLPLAAAAWLVLSSRAGQLATGWLVALLAAFPVTVAALHIRRRAGPRAPVLAATARTAWCKRPQ